MRHPQPDVESRSVGGQVVHVGDSGIGVARQREGVSFVNQTFRSEGIANAVRLRKLATVMRYPLGVAYLDTSDTGCLEGTASRTLLQRVPGSDMEAERWVMNIWFCIGQEMQGAIPDGGCGSAVWTEDGGVLGFLNYAPREGPMCRWVSCVAADELIGRGLELVDTTSRESSALA